MLSVQDVTFRFGGRTLLEKASLSVPAGHRVGLVGPNGTGKSTLFKLISGELTPDGGAITMVKGASLGYVRQDVEDEDALLIDIVLAADKERAALLKETETLEDPDRMSYVFDRLEQIGAYDAPSRAATILAGLGFDEAAQQRPIREYSGGWRNRVALAGALFTKPDLLMLDEPTNHLDFEAMVWLENFLQRYEETLIIISHDRDILNKTVSHIVHLENQKLTSYTGTYDQFERRRAERLMNQQALHEKQTAQKEKMMEFVRRFGAKASKASQAQSRLRAIEKMDIVDAVMADRVTAFAFPQPEELASPLITLDDVAIGYDGNAILKKLNLRIDMDDRIALLGANGNGKSTLVKLLAGKLEPMHGQVYKSGKLRVGYFAQFQTDELDVRETPVQVMQEAMKGAHESKVRAAIGRFGFNKDKADTRIGELSGGEKARLLFCLMSRDAPHIMLLDEPTNHLDMDAREALMQALNNYEGAVILVSHDPHLVGAVADRLWLVADGVCKPFDGDLDEYKAQVVRQRRKEKDSARAEKNKKKGRSAPADEAEALERRIAELTAERDGLENELSVASSKGDGKAIGRLSTSHAAVEKTLAEESAKLEALITAL